MERTTIGIRPETRDRVAEFRDRHDLPNMDAAARKLIERAGADAQGDA